MTGEGRGPSGTIREKHGKFYVVVRMYEGGVRKERWLSGHRTKTTAKAALRKALTAQDEGTWTPPSETMTVAEYLTKRWLPSLAAEKDLKETTRAGYARHVRVYLVPHLGGTRLDKVRASDLSAMYGVLRLRGGKTGGPLAENTVARIHATVSRAFRDAVDSDLIAVSPTARLTKKSRPTQRKASDSAALKYLTAPQLCSLLAYVQEQEPRFFPLLRLTAFTGMRRGEVVGLRWQDVSLDGGYLSVRQTITTADDMERGHGMKIVKGTPKSGKGRRVDLDDETVAVLNAWRLQQAQDRMAMGGKVPDHGLVFTREDGNLAHPDYVSGVFDRLVRAWEGGPRIRFHDLRHTHATISLSSGEPVHVVQQRLGHSSAQITLDIYGHVIPGAGAQAAARFAAAVGGA